MARLEAQSKLLYYPTPSPIIALIASWFRAPAPYRAIDPCCGKGEALAQLIGELGAQAETWGVELSRSRAAVARQCLDVVLPTDFYKIRWDRSSVSLGFNNPPYDWSSYRDREGKAVRHERLFVRKTTHGIAPGGHQVIVIPRNQLGDEKLARHLAGYYTRIEVRRFPDDLYERFKQVVVFALHRREKYKPPAKTQIEALTDLAKEGEISVLKAGSGDVEIPPTPPGNHRFQYTPVEPQDLVQAAQRVNLLTTRAYRRRTYVRPVGAPINPALPEKIGHISMEISSGEVGVVPFDDLLAKGSVWKVEERQERAQYDQGGDYSHTDVEVRERLETRIAIVHRDGRVELLTDRKTVGDFISKHADRIADALLVRNRPTYDFKPKKREWEIAGRVAKGLPRLPGREARGLFDVQKHLSIAAARVMRRYGQAILNAEMGFGVRPAKLLV